MKTKAAAVGVLAALALTACTTTDPYTGQSKISNTTGGAAIGAVGGAIGGAIIGAATGVMIPTRMRRCVAPSIRAASTISYGTPEK